MTKLQKLLFTLLIAGSTQSWASEEIDFSGMDKSAAKGVFLKILQKGDYEASKAVIKRLFSQKLEWAQSFSTTAIHNVGGNQELVALIHAKGIEQIQAAVAAPPLMNAVQNTEEEIEEIAVRAPDPVRMQILFEGDEEEEGFSLERSIREIQEYNDNVFSSVMDRGEVWKALGILADESRRPQLRIVKEAFAKHHMSDLMIDGLSDFEIPEPYMNAIYGIEGAYSFLLDQGRVGAVSDFEQKIDHEFQEEIDSGFTMAIYAQSEMVEMYLEGTFGCVPSRSVIENTLITLRTEDSSSALIERLNRYLSE